MDLKHMANIIRGLSADGVEKAGSGHPGMPLGCAEIGSVLYFDVLRHSPENPKWPNRDRFVLSAGHASMLLYSLLHLSGYDLSLDDLRNFRQLHAKTAGHPEYGHADGIETTTGPLGQGFANAVGMAIAEQMLAARFNRPGYPVVDYYTYVLCGDGCMMEGITSEASSYAGHLKLGKLIVIYDSNGITIEGSTELAFTESVKDRYLAYGWHVQEIDGHDIDQIKRALVLAKQETERPSLIVAKTNIGHGAPNKAGTAAVHGAPLGKEEILAMKRAIGLPETEFYVSETADQMRQEVISRGSALVADWNRLFNEWREKYPDLAEEWDQAFGCKLPEDLTSRMPAFQPGDKLATRAASGKTVNALAKEVPYLIGGSADLAPSNNTHMDGFGNIKAGDFTGRNFNFGIREHAMGAIMNGISLTGGFRIFGGTFLVFSDYLRPAIRLAAMMKQPVIYVFTHDSIYVGEDGPTHQPIEQTESLRLIPNLWVFRPADAEETVHAWIAALKRLDGPSALVLTRQALPVLPKHDSANMDKGGYIHYAEKKDLDLTIVAAGSEVSLAVDAAKLLEQEGFGVRVVSILCREEFMAQDPAYRDQVIPPTKPVLAVEVGVGSGWYSICPGARIRVFSLDQFGRSGKANEVGAYFGFTPDNLVKEAKQLLNQK
ncbi:MAG: transketolase [Limnochordia bacterium]|jgi:transketolase|nr:transketolase [Bacillota bacterium]HOB07907.1 transketolase [Limnochordia bacterium]NLH31200.1 transketolase [Bacillota bacterium]HPT93438.1 transketolase [Limnochordia bacterium]HPZ29940.1 transketolase [Limnochordia bacterium]